MQASPPSTVFANISKVRNCPIFRLHHDWRHRQTRSNTANTLRGARNKNRRPVSGGRKGDRQERGERREAHRSKQRRKKTDKPEKYGRKKGMQNEVDIKTPIFWMTITHAVTFLPHVTTDPSSSNAHSPSSSAVWSSCSVTDHWPCLPENNPQLISLPRAPLEVSPIRDCGYSLEYACRGRNRGKYRSLICLLPCSLLWGSTQPTPECSFSSYNRTVP